MDIEACFPVFSELRPHLAPEKFLAQVRRQEQQGYKILALRWNGEIKSIAGFRIAEYLAWGKILYIDDLSTLSAVRSQGFANTLLDRLIEFAKKSACDAVHLDSGYARHAAHRLYLNKGFELKSHHFVLDVKSLKN